MSLNVLSVAYPFAAVRPDTAGGAEQVLLTLDRSLVGAGHNSVVIACRGSKIEGKLIEVPRVSQLIDEDARTRIHREVKTAIRRAMKQHTIEVVHMHGLDFDRYLPAESVPVLVTLHLPPSWYPEKALFSNRPGIYFNCVSASQHRACDPKMKLLPYIENGVPAEKLNLRLTRRNFALSLGRICIEKGFHLALRAARRAGIGFVLAGEVFPYEEHERYFIRELRPLLGCKGSRFAGPVNLERKRRLLAAARCLLVPSLVPETSSLVAMEALACGTPVIAFKSGALADIVAHGKTGFLVNDEYEMSEAIKEIHRIDPEYCRNTARERFSSDSMISQYLSLYEKLAGHPGGNASVAEKSFEEALSAPGNNYRSGP